MMIISLLYDLNVKKHCSRRHGKLSGRRRGVTVTTATNFEALTVVLMMIPVLWDVTW
jgi:hypothetical protein